MTNFRIQSVVVFIVIIMIYWSWEMLANPPKIKYVPFENTSVKTGDIILFHAYDNVNPVFIGSYWGHIGIVYKDPDNNTKPLLFEALKTSGMKQCPEYNKRGIAITDLKTRLERYPGLIAHKRLNRPVNPHIIRGFKEFMKYAKANMYYNEKIFHNAIEKKMGGKFTNSTNCGELVYLSLVKLGLLPEKALNKNLAHHLLYTSKITKLQNNYYDEPVCLTFNKFA
jgi:hypothetical protein